MSSPASRAYAQKGRLCPDWSTASLRVLPWRLYRHGLVGLVQHTAVDLHLLCLTILEVLGRNLGEHGIGQHVFLALIPFAHFFAQLIQFRRQRIGKAASDHLIIANALLAHRLVYGSGQLAIFAAEQALALLLHINQFT